MHKAHTEVKTKSRRAAGSRFTQEVETSSRPEALDGDAVDMVDLALLQVVVPVLVKLPHGADLPAFNTQPSDLTDPPQLLLHRNNKIVFSSSLTVQV